MEGVACREDVAVGVLPDWQIQRDIKIEPFADGQARPDHHRNQQHHTFAREDLCGRGDCPDPLFAD